MPRTRTSLRLLQSLAALFALLLAAAPGRAYVEIPYSLGRILGEATNIVVLKVESVDKANRRIVYRKVSDVKGVHNGDVIKHQINNGFEPREPNTIMAWAEVGKTAVFMYNGGASETYIDGYWYQAYAGDWWGMSHGEPFLLRSYAGRAERLPDLLKQMMAGAEVVVPCMVDGDKNAIKTGAAKIQRLKQSLKLQDYNPQRDFMGWGGNDDFRRIMGMPGFGVMGQLPSAAAASLQAGPVKAADLDGDGKLDLVLAGLGRTLALKNAGNNMNEIGSPYAGPSRSVDVADFDGDGKPDILLATPTGPKLLRNTGGAFVDATSALPARDYDNATAASFIHLDGDKRPDILLANGFMGLRAYRNLGAAIATPKAPTISPWRWIGPFPTGFDTVHPPEKEYKADASYDGRGVKVAWKDANFADGQIHSFLTLFPGPDNAAVYLHRELDYGAAMDLPVSFGSDDSLKVWLNGQLIVSENTSRGVVPDQNLATLKLKPGVNRLLLKIENGAGEFGFYYAPKGQAHPAMPMMFEDASDSFKLGPSGVAGQVKGDRLLVADFNGDGVDDFVYAAGKGVLALGSPNGFSIVGESGLSFQAGGVTPIAVDFDGDGRLDLVAPQRDGCKVFRNLGGRFVDVSSQAGDLAKIPGQPVCVAALDRAKSGKPDLVVGCLSGPNRYYRNLGGGRFADASGEMGFLTRTLGTRALFVGDLNKKGVLDLVLSNEGQDSTVFLGEAK